MRVRCAGPGPVVAGASATFPASWAARATPKSPTRTRPSLPMSTFSGLKSRWMMPAACAAASPRPACANTASTSRHAWVRVIQLRKVPPSTRSMAKNRTSPTAPTSYTGTTLGWASWAIAWASRSSRARASPWPSPSLPSGNTLMAMRRSSSGS